MRMPRELRAIPSRCYCAGRRCAGRNCEGGRNPILRLVLIAIPSFLAAILPGLLVTGAFAGFLWLFVYGDDPWPGIANFAVAATFAASWTTFGMMLTRLLQQRPWTQRLSLSQLALVSLIASVAFVAAVLLRQ